MGKYRYSTFGSGDEFWARLRCHLTFSHDWEFLDGYGLTRRCKKCGLFRFTKWRR